MAMGIKVKITDESRRAITLATKNAAKTICQMFKEDCYDIEYYANLAARISSGINCEWEIVKADSEIAGYYKCVNYHTDDSGFLDVYFTFYAYNSFYGFYEIGCYYSDLMMYDGSEETNDLIRSSMFINEMHRIFNRQ